MTVSALDTQPVVGAGGGIYVNTSDSPPPDGFSDLTEVGSTWKYLGLIDEDGVEYQPLDEDTEDMNVWQLSFPWDVVTTSQSSSIACKLAQWNRATVSFLFGGGTWTDATTGDMDTFTPPGLGETSNNAVVLHVITSSGHQVMVYYRRAKVTERDETTFSKSEMSTLGVTITMLGVEGEVPQILGFDKGSLPVGGAGTFAAQSSMTPEPEGEHINPGGVEDAEPSDEEQNEEVNA